MRIPAPDRRAALLSPRACRVAGFLWFVSVSSPSLALVGGGPLPAVADPGSSGRRAVAPLTRNGTPFCTAWLASARRAVTAGHCLSAIEDLSTVDIEVMDGEGSRLPLPIVGVAVHPEADVAVLTLGAAPGEELGIVPLAWSDLEPATDLAGRRVGFAGAGTGTPRADGIAWGTCTVAGVEPARLELACEDGVAPCRGDSGGPYLAEVGDPPEVRVVAVESTGSPMCDGAAWGVRTDVVAAWISGEVDRPLPEASGACGSDPARCEGRVERRCRSGWWRIRDCASLEAGCGDLGSGLGPGCLPPACGDVDARGLCVDGQARWCSLGRIREGHCPALGLACGWDDASGGFRCIDAPPETATETLDAGPVRGGCALGVGAACIGPGTWILASLLAWTVLAACRRARNSATKGSL